MEAKICSLLLVAMIGLIFVVIQFVEGMCCKLRHFAFSSPSIPSILNHAKMVANTITQLPGAEALPGKVFNPDEVTNPAELNGTDLAIIASKMGVAENACCYIEDNVRHRAVFFISEALVIVLNSKDIVNNMHEAYNALPNTPTLPFSCFISGPSKTADIEQALVFGAHGAKDVWVIIKE